MDNARALDEILQRAGGLTGLARKLGNISVNGVAKWRRNGVPLDRCVQIEAALDGAVRCEDLRADVDWIRNNAGAVIGYTVPISQAAA